MISHFQIHFSLYFKHSKRVWAGAAEQELATQILSLCQGIFTDWSIFSTPFLLWNKDSSGPVTQWRWLVSCDWLWHSHGSLIQSRFDLKTNRSMKTSWQEYSWVECSYSQAPANYYVVLLFTGTLSYMCFLGTSSGALSICTENPEILLGKWNGTYHFIWNISEIVDWLIKAFFFSFPFELSNWYLYFFWFFHSAFGQTADLNI